MVDLTATDTARRGHDCRTRSLPNRRSLRGTGSSSGVRRSGRRPERQPCDVSYRQARIWSATIALPSPRRITLTVPEIGVRMWRPISGAADSGITSYRDHGARSGVGHHHGDMGRQNRPAARLSCIQVRV